MAAISMSRGRHIASELARASRFSIEQLLHSEYQWCANLCAWIAQSSRPIAIALLAVIAFSTDANW